MITDKKVSILVADDDIEDRYIITTAFNEIGKGDSIHCVEDGEQLLTYLDTVDSDSLPKLIIIDQNMPRLSGLETLKIIKSDDRLKQIPTIIFSTSVNYRSRDESMLYGASNYVIKPILYLQSLEIAQVFFDISSGSKPVDSII